MSEHNDAGPSNGQPLRADPAEPLLNEAGRPAHDVQLEAARDVPGPGDIGYDGPFEEPDLLDDEVVGHRRGGSDEAPEPWAVLGVGARDARWGASLTKLLLAL